MYYDRQKILSYNKVFSFAIGQRGGGKTFNFKEWCVKDFIKNGNQFVWIRRYKTELKETIDCFFDDLISEGFFEGHKLEVKGKKAYIDGEVAGHFFPLSQQSTVKSKPLPYVTKVIYDEFMIDNGMIRYLPSEVNQFLSLFDTITRERDNCRAVFIGNNMSCVNPYFDFFGVTADNSEEFNIFGEIVVHYYKNPEFANKRLKTRFGRLIENTEYGAFSLHNEVLKDIGGFIADKPNDARFSFYIRYNGMVFGVWRDYREGRIFISDKYDPSGKGFSMTLEDHQPNMMFIKDFKNYPVVKSVRVANGIGELYYKDKAIKSHFQGVLRLI